MDNLIIRNAIMNDYKDIQKIMVQLHELHVELRPDIYQSNEVVLSHSRFEELIKNKTYLVAELNRRIVGLLYYSIQYKDDDNHVKRTTLYIHTIAVDDNFKGKGIGTALLDYVKQLKKEKNYTSIELKVDAQNQSAIQMYKKNGLKEKSIIMELL